MLFINIQDNVGHGHENWSTVILILFYFIFSASTNISCINTVGLKMAS